MNYICFIGENRVGKTTMSKALLEVLTRGCRNDAVMISWADDVRAEIKRLYGIPSSIIDDRSINKNTTMINLGDCLYHKTIPALWVKYGIIKKKDEYPSLVISLRELFINHATRVRRAENPNYWVELFDKKAKRVCNADTYVIIDDTRFDTEFEYIADKNPLVYHLTNDNESPGDLAQDSVNTWIANNPDKITDRIHLPIPILQYTAEKLVRTISSLPAANRIRSRGTNFVVNNNAKPDHSPSNRLGIIARMG